MSAKMALSVVIKCHQRARLAYAVRCDKIVEKFEKPCIQ